MEKNNLGLIFLALVAVIALVGLILIGTGNLSGKVTESSVLTGFAACGGTATGTCPQGQNCIAVGSARVGWGTQPVFGCRVLSPQPTKSIQPIIAPKPVTPPPQRKCGVESYSLGSQVPTPPPLYTSASWKCYGRPQVTRPGRQPANIWNTIATNECRNVCA